VRGGVASGGGTMVPGGGRHATSGAWAIVEATIRAVFVVWGTGGACDLACAGLWGSGDRPRSGTGSFDDLAGGAPQRGDARRRLRVSGYHGAVACRAGRPTSEAGEARGQRGAADLCAGPVGWHGCRPKRGRDFWADRAVEGPPARASAGPAVGQGLEPGADCPAPAARLPWGRDDAHQPRGHLPVPLRARPRGAVPRADGLPAHGPACARAGRCACRGRAAADGASLSLPPSS